MGIVNKHCQSPDELQARNKLMHMLKLDKLTLSEVLASSIKGVDQTASFLEKPKPTIKIYEIGKVIPSKHRTSLTEIFNHLFNNALDHSIETPEVRRDRGKPEQGKINIEVSRQENCHEICFYDDGQGLDIEKLKKVLKERKIHCDFEDESSVLDSLFHDGISTQKSVSRISGRGVGMSAIKGIVDSMGEKFTFALCFPPITIILIPIVFKITLPLEESDYMEAAS